MFEQSILRSSRRSDLFDKTLFVLTVIILAAVFVLFVRHFTSEDISHRTEFSGKIVEKRVSVYESREGSQFVDSFVIEEKSGRRFQFTVTAEMYKHAEVGMWIRRDRNGVYLLDTLQQQPSPQ
jgi:hypothetical protein